MKKSEIKAYRDQLLAMRARLRGDVRNLADAALKRRRNEASGDLSSMPIHMADLGSDNFEQEFTLSLMQNEGVALEKIEAALERIDDNVYGESEECGVKSPKARLTGIPYARRCVKWASQTEHE